MSSRHSRRHSANSIESSVTRLLVSTKHLLESLTSWARKEVGDKYVSDAYVKLGNDFRAASRAFTHAGVDISDIGDVPQALRVILESALSEAPSTENLDRFLPNIRNIIVTLLQNLKSKQHKAKVMAQEKGRDVSDKERDREGTPETDRVKSPPQVSSPGHSHSQSYSHPHSASSNRSSHSRSQSQSLLQPTSAAPPSQLPPEPASSSRSSSKQSSASPPSGQVPIAASKSIPQPDSLPLPKASRDPITDKDALAQLQNESFLQRRASKRFSAYQYAKLTNINPTTSLPSVPTDRRSSSMRDSIKDRVISDSISNENNSQQEEMYVFLRLEDHTKKVPVKMPITFASLRLLFVETFAYSPGSSDFPQIYIVDPLSNVSYELEDKFINDVKSGTILCLNEIDSKQHQPFDQSAVSNDTSSNNEKDQVIKDLQETVTSLRDRLDSLDSLIVTTIKDSIAKIEFPSSVSLPTPMPSALEPGAIKSPGSSSSNETAKDAEELKDLKDSVRRNVNSIQDEVKSVKELQASNGDAIIAYINDVNSKIKLLQEGSIDSSKSSNRLYMEKCHGRLSEESDSLLTKVDDLQDLMEALRKDVAQRGVRISPQQLKMTMKDIMNADNSLKGMSNYIKSEKGVWKKIWESELDKVCEEQQFFNLQDDLTRDLEEDLSKIRDTYDLIEQCSLQQSKQSNSRRNKVVANLYIPEPGESLNSIKDAVLNEVAALRPDHDSRIEAINRAERMRQKNRELMNMTEFQEELGTFVDDLKSRSTGSISEIEKQRQLKDSENLKSSFGGI